MIKTSKNVGLDSVVDSTTNTYLLSDTTLRSFIPPQVHKKTPRLRHICGCEILIIPKDMHIDLHILRKDLVTYYQQK